MKLIPIDMEYCLLQFDVIKFFLGVHLHGGESNLRKGPSNSEDPSNLTHFILTHSHTDIYIE